MSASQATNPATRLYRVEVTETNAVILPEELSHLLGVSAGDVVELHLDGEQAVLRRVPKSSSSGLKGLLSGYFKDREDVQRFIDEERRLWDDD
jgi:bifunctional DNA-binding transcriptional regulator/antitoxin component of YhaV-PrlF toxin-antitoxin module